MVYSIPLDFSCPALGRAGFPLHSRAGPVRTCKRAGACPTPEQRPAAGPGFKNTSRDEATVRRWFEDDRLANAGFATVALVVMDIAPSDGGDVSLVKLEEECRELTANLVVKTFGGGVRSCLAHLGAAEKPGETSIHLVLIVRNFSGRA